jgi:ABC-2 type transport system ATP-binding protein
MNLIETRNLTKLYGVVIGVNDVTLDVPKGVRGLLGPNGAGKSTFLKLVTGQLKPTEGSLTVLGERPWNNPPLFRKIGFCPEQDSFYGFLTGFEFVKTLARIGGFDSAEATRRAETALERVGATDYMHRKIGTYSRGMRQRTKVAQALVHDPEFLILDEPLSGTDPIGRREMTDLVRSLGREGRSILISSHVLHEVQAVTEDFLLMYGGRMLASGNVHEIRGLMNEVPHRITIRCREGRALAHRLMRDLPIAGVEMNDRQGTFSVLTHDPGSFYAGLPAVVGESGAKVTEMVSQDDNLDAVFRYLVTRD